MADFGAAMYALIQTKAAITALVSTRVFPTVLPQTNPDLSKPLTMPSMTYNIISDVQSRHLSGVEPHADTLIQFDYYGDTRTSVVGLADAVRNALNNHDGAAGDETVTSMYVQQQIDGFDPPVDGSPESRYRISQDWRVHFVQSTS